MKRLRWPVAAIGAAVLLAGCGEISNTITPAPGTANTITVALDAAPNFSHVGMFEAQALGYYKQTDLVVKFTESKHPIAALQSGAAQIAVSNPPAILSARNQHIALAAVAAILQGPQRVTVTCKAAKTAGGTGKTKGKTQTTAPRAHPPLRAPHCSTGVIARPDPRYAKAPTYNGMNLVVTENEIVNHAPLLRRFVQATARGYAAARRDPEGATDALVKADPSLDASVQLAGVRASLKNFFPADPKHPWGWQTTKQWNAFGTWMMNHHLITNPNATPDADTNELLAGQGV